MPGTPPSVVSELALLSSWWKISLAALGAGFSGGFGVKVVDYAYAEFQRFRERRTLAQEVVDKHLDPILKAGEDLVGELRSLALHDFVEFKRSDDESGPTADSDLANLLSLWSILGAHSDTAA
jgi:hypothetical protein